MSIHITTARTGKLCAFLLILCLPYFTQAQGSIRGIYDESARKMLEFKKEATCPEWKDFYQKMSDCYTCKAREVAGERKGPCPQPDAPKTQCPTVSTSGNAAATSATSSQSAPQFSGIGGQFGTTTYGDPNTGRTEENQPATGLAETLSIANFLSGGSLRKNGAGALIDAGLSLLGSGSGQTARQEKQQLARKQQEVARQKWERESPVMSNADAFFDQYKEAEALLKPTAITPPAQTNADTSPAPPVRSLAPEAAPSGSTSSSGSKEKATLLIRTDMDIVVLLDGEKMGTFSANESIQKITTESGKFLMSILSKEGKKLQDDKWLTLVAGDKQLMEFTFGAKLKKELEAQQLAEEKVKKDAARNVEMAGKVKANLARITTQMVRIPGGKFEMGYSRGTDDAKREHKVTISDFDMAPYETTYEDFAYFVFDANYEPSQTIGIWFDMHTAKPAGTNKHNWMYNANGERVPDVSDPKSKHPVVFVSWLDATKYCEWLSQKTGQKFRLPTEAEWEYVARNGQKQTIHPWSNKPFTSDDVADNLMDLATYKAMENGGGVYEYKWQGSGSEVADAHIYTAPVGSYRPNTFGLYDLGGNASEWCLDAYDKDYYRNSPSENPVNNRRDSGNETKRVFRGLSFRDPFFFYKDPTSIIRRSIDEYTPFSFIGFRVVRTK